MALYATRYMQTCYRNTFAYFAKTRIQHIFSHLMAFPNLHMQKLHADLHTFTYFHILYRLSIFRQT